MVPRTVITIEIPTLRSRPTVTLASSAAAATTLQRAVMQSSALENAARGGGGFHPTAIFHPALFFLSMNVASPFRKCFLRFSSSDYFFFFFLFSRYVHATLQFVNIGIVTNIEVNHKQIDCARKGQEVCIKITPTPGDAPKLYGRHFDHKDMLVSKVLHIPPFHCRFLSNCSSFYFSILCRSAANRSTPAKSTSATTCRSPTGS